MDGTKLSTYRQTYAEVVFVSAVPNCRCVHPPVNLAIDVCGVSVKPKPCIRDTHFVIDVMFWTSIGFL